MTPSNHHYDQLVQLTQAIRDDLALLSALQATELEAETLAEIKALGFPDGLGLHLKSAESIDVLNRLSELVQQWPDKADSNCLTNLAVDFAAIYLNAQTGASPHESFWIDEERLLMQKPMFEVRDRYFEQGMKVKNWRSRADDHIVNELNFLANVIEIKNDSNTLSIAARFLDEHLLRWIGQFSDRVASHSESDFYSGLALLTTAYCEELRDLLAVILNKPRPKPKEIETRMKEKYAEPIRVAPPQIGSGAGPTW